AALAGCSSEAHDAVRRDTAGHYATTSQYGAMGRADFTAAMEAGMADFDARLATLQTEAQRLGPDAIEEYHDALDDLTERRRAFEAEFERHRAMLGNEWTSHREGVAEEYVDLRKHLDEAWEDVVDEA
ncbi:MAG TPA: hypothetical protein VK824_00045, partial [Planctomycetota bacterium]|nr:hypothetical protein [Planctomycetota bacterium]